MNQNRFGAYPTSFWALTFVGVIGWAGMVVTPLLTLYLTVQLGLTPIVAGMILSIYGVGGTVAVVFSGVVVDALGAKQVLIGAMAISVAMNIALSFATSIPLICVLVLIYGAAAQSMQPAYNTLVTETAPLFKLREAFSIQMISGNLGFATLPLIGGILAGLHYSLIFYFESALVLAAMAIVITLIPLHVNARGGSDGAGGAGSTIESPGVRSRLAFLIEMVGVFRDGVFLRFLIASIVYATMFKQTQITMPLIMDEQGHGAGYYGFILTLNGLGVVLLQLPADRLTRRMNASRVVVLGALITSAGLFLQAFANSAPSYAIIVVVWTVGELFHFAISANIASQLAPEGYRGRYLGVFALANCVASLLGPLFGGFALELTGSTGLWLLCGSVLLALAVFRWACRHEIDRRMGIAAA